MRTEQIQKAVKECLAGNHSFNPFYEHNICVGNANVVQHCEVCGAVRIPGIKDIVVPKILQIFSELME